VWTEGRARPNAMSMEPTRGEGECFSLLRSFAFCFTPCRHSSAGNQGQPIVWDSQVASPCTDVYAPFAANTTVLLFTGMPHSGPGACIPHIRSSIIQRTRRCESSYTLASQHQKKMRVVKIDALRTAVSRFGHVPWTHPSVLARPLHSFSITIRFLLKGFLSSLTFLLPTPNSSSGSALRTDWCDHWLSILSNGQVSSEVH